MADGVTTPVPNPADYPQSVNVDTPNRKRIRSPTVTTVTNNNCTSPEYKKVRNNSDSSIVLVADDIATSQLSVPNTNMALPTESTMTKLIVAIDKLTARVDQTATKEDLKAATAELVNRKEFSDLNDRVDTHTTLLNKLSLTVGTLQSQIPAGIDSNNSGLQSQSQVRFVSPQYLNVVVEGLPELNRSANTDTMGQIIGLLHKVNVNLEPRDFSIVKRLPRRSTADHSPRPVLVCFIHPHTRESVLARKSDLFRIESCKTIYLNPDEPIEIRRLKSRFRKIAFFVRANGGNCVFNSEGIKINDVEYPARDLDKIPTEFLPHDLQPNWRNRSLNAAQLDEVVGGIAMDTAERPQPQPTRATQAIDEPTVPPLLPSNLGPDRIDLGLDPKNSLGLPTLQSLIDNPKIKIRLTKSGLVFSGPTAFISNMATSPFVYENVDYVSVEQSHQTTKAVISVDMQAAFDIMKEPKAFEIHKRGKRIVTNEAWNRVCCPKLRDQVIAKYNQNPGLKAMLIATYPIPLVEGSTDPRWGGGAPFDSPLYDSQQTTGRNEFGIMATGIRDDFKRELDSLATKALSGASPIRALAPVT